MEKSKYVIVICNDNWADEMDVEGVQVILRSEYEELYNKVKDFQGPVNICFVTNEYQEYSDVNEFLDTFSVKECTDEFAESYKTLIGNVGFVFTELVEQILWDMED